MDCIVPNWSPPTCDWNLRDFVPSVCRRAVRHWDDPWAHRNVSYEMADERKVSGNRTTTSRWKLSKREVVVEDKGRDEGRGGTGRDGEGRRGPGHLWAPGFCLARSPRQIPQKLPLVRVLPLLPVVRVRCSLVNLPYISIRVVVARFRTLQTVRRRAVDAPYSICPPSHLTTHAHSHVQKTNGASRVVSTMAKKSVGDLSKADLEGKVRVRLRSSPCLPLPVSLSPSPSVSLSLGND